MEPDRLRSRRSLVDWSTRNGRPLDADPKVARSARDLGLLPPEPKFIDGEPPPAGGNVPGSFDRRWAPVVEQLRARPGAWADLGEVARHVARRIPLRFPDVETTARRVAHERVRLFARARPGG